MNSLQLLWEQLFQSEKPRSSSRGSALSKQHFKPGSRFWKQHKTTETRAGSVNTDIYKYHTNLASVLRQGRWFPVVGLGCGRVGALRKASETPNTADEDDSYHTGPCKEPNNAISRLLWGKAADNVSPHLLPLFSPWKTYCITLKKLMRSKPNANELLFNRNLGRLHLGNSQSSYILKSV